MMKVTKRNGQSVPMLFDKVTERISKLVTGLHVSPDKVAQKVFSSMTDGIATSVIDELSADVAINMISEDPDYEVLASRIIVSNTQKLRPKTFSAAMNLSGLFHYQAVERYDSMISPDRDYDFSYFGIKTLLKMYLGPHETPQYMFMRVALGIHGTSDSQMDAVKDTYDLMSQKYFTHATPTLFNAGTGHSQLSSCFLTGIKDDSITGIYDTLKDCAQISKWSGGIGFHLHNVRATGSEIRGTNGHSDGIIPMLRTFNATARYVNQCFRGDTIVYSTDGPIRIDEIKISDQLITIDGTPKKVNEVIRNHVSKEILVIRPTHSMEPVRVTPEHEVYTIQGIPKMTNYSSILYRLDKRIVEPKFVSASSLSDGDFVGYPIPNTITDFPEDPAYFRFYGIMIGDGHMSKNEFGLTFGFSKENTYTFAMQFLKSRGIHVWTGVDDIRHTIRLRWSGNVDKLNLTRDMLYDSNNEKHIDPRFMNLPHEKTLGIIAGLMETDGGITHEVQFYNTSKNVVYSLRYLLLRIGVLSSGCIHNNVGKSHEIRPGEYITNKKISWSVRIPKHPNLRPIFGDSIEYSTTVKFLEWNGILWSRIKRIGKEHFDGYVYDLNMQDNHNYLTDMGLVHNSGKRKGSFAAYLEPWHSDIFEFLELRLNQGDEEARCRDLFTALWIPDLFMKRLGEGKPWSLFCPDKAPGLSDVWGDKFEKLYLKYESMGLATKTIPIEQLWSAILKSQIETGTPYMLYKDHCNRKSNQRHLGTIKSSNLCTEIIEYTDPGEIAVCNLASICLPKFVNESDGTFDYQKLEEVTRTVTRNLDKIIDVNFYPVPEAERSNKKHRPVAIGVQGLADVYQMLGLDFGQGDLNRLIFETIYWAACLESVRIAAVKGPHSSFVGSPWSQGLFQFDLWGVTPSDRYDWESIRGRPIRNSLLVGPMPTATTSQIMGNNECFEPYTSNMYLRRTLAGEFVVLNKHLVTDLKALGIWSKQVKDDIVRNQGSVQTLDIPEDLKNRYKTVWEISQKIIIDMAAERGPYICQSQSMNLHVEDPTASKLSSIHMYAWKQGLKTGMYYLRTRPKARAIQFTLEPEAPAPACRRDNPGCISCSG